MNRKRKTEVTPDGRDYTLSRSRLLTLLEAADTVILKAENLQTNDTCPMRARRQPAETPERASWEAHRIGEYSPPHYDRLLLDNRTKSRVYWTGEVMVMVDKDMLEAINQLLDPIREDLSDIKDRVEQIETRTTKMEIIQENVTNKNIQLLLEGQQGINDKFTALDEAEEGVEDLKVRVFALEETSKKQASQIRELRMAK